MEETERGDEDTERGMKQEQSTKEDREEVKRPKQWKREKAASRHAKKKNQPFVISMLYRSEGATIVHSDALLFKRVADNSGWYLF